jgi:TctA family transporter
MEKTRRLSYGRIQFSGVSRVGHASLRRDQLFHAEAGFPVAPMVLPSVLAQMLATSLAQALLISQGSPFIFFTRPIFAVFMVLAILSIVRGIWVQLYTKAPEVTLDEAD